MMSNRNTARQNNAAGDVAHQPQDNNDSQASLWQEGLPPKVIRTASVKRPIHIEPASAAATRIGEPPPQPTPEVFEAICDAYSITPTQCRQLLHALTQARLLLGYKHPLARFQPPTTPFAA